MNTYDLSNYTTFIRSARNFEEFGSAQKFIHETDLTWHEAREQCENFNSNRTEKEIEMGIKMEFSNDPDYLSDAVEKTVNW